MSEYKAKRLTIEEVSYMYSTVSKFVNILTRPSKSAFAQI